MNLVSVAGLKPTVKYGKGIAKVIYTIESFVLRLYGLTTNLSYSASLFIALPLQQKYELQS